MGLTIKREISIGTLLQLGGLLLSALWFAQRTTIKQDETLAELRVVHARVDRMEKYLSSKDPAYWEIIRRIDEGSPFSLKRPLLDFIPTQEKLQ